MTAELPDSKILIVDDVTENIKILINLFEKQYDIFFSKEGKTALDLAITQKPDLILLDIIMPDMDGYEVCRQLKAHKKTREIPVIFISTLEDVDEKVKGFKAGCVDYITRPFLADEVKIRVNNQITLFRLQTGLESQIKLRTAEMERINRELQAEIQERSRAENELKNQRQVLEDANITLKTILAKKDEAKHEMEESILSNVKQTVNPYLEKLKHSGLTCLQQEYVNLLETKLNDLVSPLIRILSSNYLNLTATEIKVADLIRHGRSTKGIAGLLGLSFHTIEFHRKNIRKKLGLTDKHSNLRTYLTSLQ
jgi:response regulator RpfG family c-di-GMP phosphodiesterase/DNA-binding CsgD family transcriptional regulator